MDHHLRTGSGAVFLPQLGGHADEPPVHLDHHPDFTLFFDSSLFSSSTIDPERRIAAATTPTTGISALRSGGSPNHSSLDVEAPGGVTEEIGADFDEYQPWNASLGKDEMMPRSGRQHAPTQLGTSLGGHYPTIPAPDEWDISMVKSGPEMEQPSPQSSHNLMALEEMFHVTPLIGTATSASYIPAVAQSPALLLNLWAEIPAQSDFVSRPQALFECNDLGNSFFNDGLSSAALNCKASPSTELYLPSPSPNPLSSNPRKRRASTVYSDGESTDISAPCPTPHHAKQKAQPRSKPAASFEIIQYKPAEGKLSKGRRPVVDEVTTGSRTPQTLRRIEIEDGSGQTKGTMITLGKRIKTRSTFSDEKRQQTAMARKEGVCARCKRSKRLCDLAAQGPYVSCSLCKGSKLYKGVLRMPCFRSTLVEVLFFRPGPSPNEPLFTRRNTVFSLEDLSAPNVPVKTLQLTQNIGSHRLTVYASEFDPHPEDVLTYKWKDSKGQTHIMEMPHFCLTNMDKVQAHFQQYIVSAKWSYLESLKRDDDFSWMTVSMAMEYAKNNPDSLVANSLDLWAISRMIEIPWEMCGGPEDDTLGVSRIEEPENPHHGKIPIPPIMDTQLDQIVIQNILKPLREQVISKFQALITPAKPETWFEIYLAAFIMLNHIERLAKHSVFHAKLHSMRTKYSNVSFLEGAFHTAKIILSRFHFVCNGSAPLRLDWRDSKTNEMAQLKPPEVEFMKKTQSIIRAREKDVVSLRKTRRYEQTLYWCHQLYFEDWDRSPVHVIDEQ
ncbi:hypothetical protein QBC35DRAFT_508751 [Podospora australis]|uniref:Zn(2)-C6 fungal-type domain-containing protein n=1 Tax=Podospora australis TaxID=1536484 RepID=A0AAN7AC21_9PEZI|nr:hypothetical protein QBC35DRAFT_508751 [Podospora australis]